MTKQAHEVSVQMVSFSQRLPLGFTAALGDLGDLGRRATFGASSRDVEALNQGEDLAVFDHLLLDAGVHIDARTDAFHVSVLSGVEGAEMLHQCFADFGEALGGLDRALCDIWSLDIPWRAAETTYHGRDDAVVQTWFPPGGWTILVDDLAGEGGSSGTTPLELAFAATSSHRSLAIYRLLRAGRPAPYAGLLWAEPPGRLYERIYLHHFNDLSHWLQARLRHDALPRRPKRR